MKEAYKHDYGRPTQTDIDLKVYMKIQTFSVGIFQWIPTKSRSGLRKSAVKYRVKGKPSNPEEVFARADQVVKNLNAGWVPIKKSEAVK